MTDNKRTWRDNAHEFAELDRGEGWQFAILVACSAERRQRGATPESTIVDSAKASLAGFAREAKTSDVRVTRYLDAWQAAAAKGWVPDASTLTPADAHTLDVPEQPWRAKDGGVYDASRTGGQINNTEQIADKARTDPDYGRRVVEAVNEATGELYNPTGEQIRHAIRTDVELESAADDALSQVRSERHDRSPRPAVKESSKNERYVRATTAARAARANVQRFSDAVIGQEWTPGETEGLALMVDQLRQALDLVHEGLNTGSWDDELAKLLAGGEDR